MRLKLLKKDDDLIEHEKLSAKLGKSDKKKNYFLLAIRALLQFVKDFSLDLEELKSDEFKKNMSHLSQTFTTEKKLKKIQALFEKDKKTITAYINRQKDYLIDRENEFKDIIDILTKAIVTLDTENQEYNQKIVEQSEKIEQITLLDDIKKIKQALIEKIEQMRETVKEKQSRDTTELEILSQQVSALNVQLKKARADSVTDGLTGIYNRKAFDRHIDELVEKNTVSSSPFSLLMLDIDDFKTINDAFGHPIGDQVILAIINKCQKFIRGDDFFARYGGEEFVIILSGASLRNAVKKANKICKAIASTRYFLDDVPGEQTLLVTVSIGVSTHQEADSVSSVTERADKALYAAKRAGKNCVFSEKDMK